MVDTMNVVIEEDQNFKLGYLCRKQESEAETCVDW